MSRIIFALVLLVAGCSSGPQQQHVTIWTKPGTTDQDRATADWACKQEAVQFRAFERLAGVGLIGRLQAGNPYDNCMKAHGWTKTTT